MKYLFVLTFLSLFISCNVVKVVGGGDTKISDDFFNNGQVDCSTCNSTLTCPVGYVYVSGNTSLGTNDFCVMAYEAKNVGGVATSQENLTAWDNITPLQAKTACTNLGANYDLISNSEWMTIARDIENNSANWPSGTVGSGCLLAGNVGTSNTCAYAGGAVESGASRNSLASHTLSNGSVVWDLSGNAIEWVDWTLGGGFDEGPYGCPLGANELNTVSCSGLNTDDFMPLNSSLTTTNCIGNFSGATSAGSAMRGGLYNNGCTNAGLFDLSFQSTTYSSAGLGFRCVYR